MHPSRADLWVTDTLARAVPGTLLGGHPLHLSLTHVLVRQLGQGSLEPACRRGSTAGCRDLPRSLSPGRAVQGPQVCLVVGGEAIPHWLLPQPAVTPGAVLKPLCCISATQKREWGGSLNRAMRRGYPAPVQGLEEPAVPIGPCQGQDQAAPQHPRQAQPPGAAPGQRPALSSPACPFRRL